MVGRKIYIFAMQIMKTYIIKKLQENFTYNIFWRFRKIRTYLPLYLTKAAWTKLILIKDRVKNETTQLKIV